MNDSLDTSPIEDLGHQPDARKVEALAGFGLTAAEIATLLEIDVEALKNACGKELESGAIKANARVAESLFRKATSGDGRESVTAAIFWLKTRARWKEASARDDEEENDPEIIFKVVYEAEPPPGNGRALSATSLLGDLVTEEPGTD